MEFVKYQHVERFGTTETQNIELGECYVFPKIDGANASVWHDGEIKCGSRRRELTLEKDNAGFCQWVKNPDNHNLEDFFMEYPQFRLFGEWLVPHSLKTYRDEAWKQFYVFDVTIDKIESEITHEGDNKLNYLHYNDYYEKLEAFGIKYISPISIIENATQDQLIMQLKKNVFLIEDGKGVGEGIVLKNYDFKNKYGRQTWAKIVTSEFKERHSKTMGAPEMKGKRMVELEIATKYVTTALCEKVKAKIEIENNSFGSRDIPRLLNTVFYDIVKEESWNFVKENKNPVIDFNRMQHFVFAKVKECMPILF